MKPCDNDPDQTGRHYWENWDGSDEVNCIFCDAKGVVVEAEEK